MQILLVHGMWGHGDEWSLWREALAEREWETHAPTLRHHDLPASAKPPEQLGRTSILDYAGDLETAVRNLPEPPVVIGHSMGGLLAQILAARGAARAAVLLTPAAPRGVIALRPSVLWSFRRQLVTPAFWRRPHRPTFAQATSSMLHLLPEEERRRVFSEMRWESGRAMFEIGLALLDRRRASQVDPERVRCPVLAVAARHDRIVPASVVRQIARRYDAELVELPDHAHWVLSGPGWRNVAGRVIDWVERSV